MQVYKGRPTDIENRLPKEVRVYELLDELKIDYDRIDHEPAMTMELCAEIDTVLGTEICKNLLLCNRQCTDFYLLMISANKIFKTKDLSKQIGSARLSFAAAEYMEQFLDITPGSVSVLGLINDTENRVQLLIDDELLNEEYFGCHPCINTSSLKLRMSDLLETILPKLNHKPIIVNLPTPEEAI